MKDSPEQIERIETEKSFVEELSSLLNRRSKESASNTPDYILAQYLEGCLDVFATAIQQRETWHGRDARPSHTRYGIELCKHGKGLTDYCEPCGRINNYEN